MKKPIPLDVVKKIKKIYMDEFCVRAQWRTDGGNRSIVIKISLSKGNEPTLFDNNIEYTTTLFNDTGSITILNAESFSNENGIANEYRTDTHPDNLYINYADCKSIEELANRIVYYTITKFKIESF